MKIPDSLVLPFSGADHTSKPVIIERGEGPYVFDTEGKKYLDGFSALWTTLLGYQHSEITRAITEQTSQLCHATLYGQAHIPAIELTEKLLSFLKLDNHTVLYAHSGSEAVEAALKIAVNYWSRVYPEGKRRKILTFRDSYHGETSGAMSTSGFDSHNQMFPGLVYNKLEADSPVSTKESTYKERPTRPDFKTLFEQHQHELAAVIIEPIYGAAGVLIPDTNFLKRIAETCKEKGILLIVDEVATGYYRMGPRFHFQELGIEPDLLVLGKGMTAGHLPLSATLLGPKVAAEYAREQNKEPLFHGHTYAGNPLACEAAKAALDIYSRPGFESSLTELTKVFKNAIFRLTNPNIIEVRQRGLFAGLELFDPHRTKINWSEVALEACNNLKDKGILLRPLGNVLVLAPPAVCSGEEINYLVDSVADAIESVDPK